MSFLLDLLKKFTPRNINTLGEYLFSIFILFLLTNIFFPLKQYHNVLINEIRNYYTRNIILNEILHCIYHMLFTLFLLMLTIHLLYTLLYLLILVMKLEYLSKKDMLEFALGIYRYFVQKYQFPILIWIINISFFLYYIDSSFLQNTINNIKEILFPFTIFTIPFLISCIITVLYCFFTILEKFFAFSDSIHKIDQI